MGESGCQHSAQKQSDTLLNRKIGRIAHTFVVMSGKGGVGKSTVAVNLAISLAMHGLETGLLDLDLHGPSVPKMLGLSSERFGYAGEEIAPVEVFNNLKVVSIGFMLKSDDEAVIMRGPMKAGLVRQFLENVCWGDLDCLVVDCPPGTGDEPLSIVQMLNTKTSSAIIVTTPQQMATIDVEKSISFCRQLELPIAGIIENMSGFVCPHCHKGTDIFSSGGGKELAERFGTAFLGSIQIDPNVVKSGDSERPYLHAFPGTETSARFDHIVEQLQSAHLSNGAVSDCYTEVRIPLKTDSAMVEYPREVVENYPHVSLETGANSCDH